MEHDVESIERATFSAIPPGRVEETAGWLVGLDDGTVGRAHSAAPLSHAAPRPGAWQAVCASFDVAGREPVARVPRMAAFDAFREEMQRDGWIATQPTMTMTGSAPALAAMPGDAAGVALDGAASPGWESLFLGEGFDPVDGASRIAILRRARDALFASVTVDGQVAAVGFGSFGHGWASVHGMRTAPTFRGRRFASAILSAFGREALRRGLARTFLQVEERNAGAQALYRKAGFTPAWVYEYLRRPA